MSLGGFARRSVSGARLYRRGAFAIQEFSGPSSDGIKMPSSNSSNRCSVRGFSIEPANGTAPDIDALAHGSRVRNTRGHNKDATPRVKKSSSSEETQRTARA